MFDEKVRDILLETDITNITNVVRGLVRKHGKTISADAKEKFDAGIFIKHLMLLALIFQK